MRRFPARSIPAGSGSYSRALPCIADRHRLPRLPMKFGLTGVWLAVPAAVCFLRPVRK